MYSYLDLSCQRLLAASAVCLLFALREFLLLRDESVQDTSRTGYVTLLMYPCLDLSYLRLFAALRVRVLLALRELLFFASVWRI